MIQLFFLLLSFFFLFLGSFSLVPELSSGVIFFIWFIYGSLRFNFNWKALLFIFSLLFFLSWRLSDLNFLNNFLWWGMPYWLSVIFVNFFIKFNLLLKSFLGSLIFMFLFFLSSRIIFGTAAGFPFWGLSFLLILFLLDFLALKTYEV